MYLIERRRLLVFLILAFLLPLVIGIGAVVISGAPDSSSRAYYGEILLFLTLLALVVLGGVTWRLLTSARNIEKDLDVIIDMLTLEGYSPERALRRLGRIGPKLYTIFERNLELSTLKGRRIDNLRRVVTILAANIERPLILFDPVGRILIVTAAAADYLERPGRGFQEVCLQDLFPGLDFERLLFRLERSRTTVPESIAGEERRVTPVFEQGRLIGGAIALDGREIEHTESNVYL